MIGILCTSVVAKIKITCLGGSSSVFNKAFINDQSKDILVSLYQPIIGVVAVNLYLTLTNDLLKDKIEKDQADEKLKNSTLSNLEKESHDLEININEEKFKSRFRE